MNKYAIYSYAFKRSNELTGVKALKNNKGHYMIGEVCLDSKIYDGKNIEEACLQRIEEEVLPKNGLQHFIKDDILNFQCFLCEGAKSHQDAKFRNFIRSCNGKIKVLKDKSTGKTTEILTGISKDEIKYYF